MATKKKVIKKKQVIKKATKKEILEMKLKLANGELETKKRVYGEYIKALVKYDIKGMAYSAIMYDELFHTALMRRLDSAKNAGETFSKLIFGEGKQTKLERVKENTEYYDKLISIAQSNISRLSNDIQTKIAKDSIEKQYAWLNIPELNGN